MARSADEILAAWRSNVPPTVPIGDVERVVKAYFPDAYRQGGKTSHFIVIHHEALEIAQKHGYRAHFRGGNLSISHVHGREVKKIYVDQLRDAVDLVIQFTRARKQGRGK
ncbi:MAG TPA: hypothetical protein VGN26_08325 [Armatimonadota bacterium]|jgi:hypothetical protein